MNLKRLFVTVLVLTACFFLLTSNIQAQTGVAIHPAFTETQPQESYRFNLTNSSNSNLTFDMAVIRINQFDLLGRPILETSPFAPTTNPLGSINPSSLDLAPGQTGTFYVQISPNLLQAGGNYFLVAARWQSATNLGNAGTQSQVKPMITALLTVSQPKDQKPDLQLESVNAPKGPISLTLPKALTLTFKNEGNIHTVPYGNATLQDSFGRVVERGPINESSFFVMPQNSRQIPVVMASMRSALPLSIYTLTINGNNRDGTFPYAYQQRFIYIPIWLLGSIPLIIGLAFTYLKKRLK